MLPMVVYDYNLSIRSNTSAQLLAKCFAPFCSNNALSRNPHNTLIQVSPAFFAVCTSTSESPIYTALSFVTSNSFNA